ncbi:MAG: thiamine pyrophosphate-dependent dehydrogenase E1 component subunit alpha [Dehalococcoidia bacterium]
MDRKTKIEMLRRMLLIRHLENKWGEAYQRQEIDGIPPSLSTGQEAVSVGACMALKPGDFVFTTHRGVGPQVAMGMDPDRIMADVCYKATGYNKGKSYHVTSIEHGVVGTGGIVGGQIPVAAGLALAFKLRGLKQVAMPFFGEGASNEGAFHEAANLAAIWKLPVIFLCENNMYAISLRFEEFIPVKSVAIRAKAYGMPGVTVDGNDVISVYEAVRKAAERARRGLGPSLVEAKTYRLAGHLLDDPGHYRPKEEVKEQWSKCPILRFKTQLESEGILKNEDMDRLEREIKEVAEKAADFARKSPCPEAEEAFTDIFA